jgi:hypothetical protein
MHPKSPDLPEPTLPVIPIKDLGLIFKFILWSVGVLTN